jgi:hypothetical protein
MLMFLKSGAYLGIEAAFALMNEKFWDEKNGL